MINDMDKKTPIRYRKNLLARLSLLNKKTKIIGLTGSIGMGKTTTCTIIKNLGYDVFDSDAVAHKLTKKGELGFFAIKFNILGRFALKSETCKLFVWFGLVWR